ncbi:MAG: helicase C-terminal domain-containing protein [Candidatus Dormiibacterota bacterium]
MDEFVALDLETTGLSPKTDRVIEVGAVRFDLDGGAPRRMELLVDPGVRVPLPVQRLTGISDADLAGQPSAVEALAQLADFCAGAELVGHGAGFDLAFCAQLVPEAFAHRTAVDTLELARILLPLAESHNLGALCRLLGLPHERPHRALSDADATGLLLRALLDTAAQVREETLDEMSRVAGQAPTPLARFFALVDTAVRSGSTGSARVSPSHTAPRPAPESPEAQTAEVAAAGDGAGGQALPSLGLADTAVALIGPSGRLAERPGYEYREAQAQMARAVAQTLERGGRLLVEAGTGVGKTLGYLAPLALWAEREGGRAVVATHTVTLQEQIAHHDLPALQPLLPRPLSWAILKGRSHYISLRRFRRYLGQSDVGPHGPDLDAIRFKLKLLRWLDLTSTGDRGELRLGSAERELWRQVESTTHDCLGSACANWTNAACHMVWARRAAAAAELVVTNHALLLSDAAGSGSLLGVHEALVVDEAHHLEESATRASGHRLRAGDVSIALDRLPGVIDLQLADGLESSRAAVRRLFGEAKGMLTQHLGGGEGAPSGTLSLTDELRQEPRFQGLVAAAQHASLTLRRIADRVRAADPVTALRSDLFPQPGNALEELRLAASALEASADGVEEVLLRPRPGHVAWLELRAEQAELHDAPVAVGESLGTELLDRCRTTVLTSATLAVAGDFGFIRERLGLRSRTEELTVGSPYDFLAQSLCVLVTDIPPYDDPGYEPALAAMTGEIARRLEGRTLGLFTSYSSLRRIRDLVSRRLAAAQVAVVGQGIDGTRRQLLASFLQSPRTLLLGTSTFWEGIDVPGDALQCVVIAKLPFAVPTDPLVRARTEGMADPFGGYVLPEAVIRLRQGFGRLIRSTTDRGVVVIADSRLTNREYARRFLEALPPAAIMRESSAAVAARIAEFIATGVAAAVS